MKELLDWLRAAHAARSTCQNPHLLDQAIIAAERRLLLLLFPELQHLRLT